MLSKLTHNARVVHTAQKGEAEEFDHLKDACLKNLVVQIFVDYRACGYIYIIKTNIFSIPHVLPDSFARSQTHAHRLPLSHVYTKSESFCVRAHLYIYEHTRSDAEHKLKEK